MLFRSEISEGNSGGPLVNAKGEVVGVNSFYIKSKASDSSVTVKANYAVAIDELINSINRDVIPITVAGETNTTLLAILVIAGILLLAVIVIILALTLQKRKSAVAVAATVTAPVSAVQSMPVTAPVPERFHEKAKTVTLTGLSGYFEGKAFSVESQIRLGRDSNVCAAAFPVDQPGISGCHCQIVLENNAVYLKDLGSSFGTFMADGTKLTAQLPVKLKDGDRFYLADAANLFEIKIR